MAAERVRERGTLRHPAGRTALVAIGGNALMPSGGSSVADQRARMAETSRRIASLVDDGWRVVITHGNGPQVGAALLRSERAADEAYPLPLDLCVASTQGEMGFLLQEALGEALEARGLPTTGVASVVTRVLVSPEDVAFQHPTKPIGPFYSSAEADALRRSGWELVEQPPRGYRRVVPSPEPLEIPEEDVVRTLLGTGAVVVALGGGGVPVARREDRLAGVEAVVDKDLSSALLAVRLRAQLFLVITDVDGVYLDFGTQRARRLECVSARELRAHAAAGQFPPGSMGPKVEAVLRFLESGGPHAVVTLPERIEQALMDGDGTHAFGEEPWSASAR